MALRRQTQTNRHLGLNAGQQRREAASNREEMSQERRAKVFRQDVEHTGTDRIRAPRVTQRDIKVRAAEPAIVAMRAAGMTYEQMMKASGLSQQDISKIMSRNGLIRRGPARPRMTP